MEFFHIKLRCDGGDPVKTCFRTRAKFADNASDFLETLIVVRHLVVGDAADLAVHRRPAEQLVVDLLTNGGFDEMRTGEKHTPGFIHDQRFIAHDWEIRTTGNTRSHDGSNLRDTHGRHDGIVPEDAAEMLFVREDLTLQWQEYARRINQINDGEPVLDRNFLGAEVLLAGNREPRPGFHRGIISDDNHFTSVNFPNPKHRPRRRRTAIFFIHLERSEQPDLKEVASGINQFLDSLACGELAFLVEFLDSHLAAAKLHRFGSLVYDIEEFAVGLFVLQERGGLLNCGTDLRHERPSL